jgi:Bacterial protein of unknown function (DUF885)
MYLQWLAIGPRLRWTRRPLAHSVRRRTSALAGHRITRLLGSPRPDCLDHRATWRIRGAASGRDTPDSEPIAQALKYLADNTALSTQEVHTETDRYIANPGHALAYKMDELKLWELRARSQKALGERFDVCSFHDAALANGALPLPVLERQIDEYIAAARARGSASGGR